jgi:hypothetical protein
MDTDFLPEEWIFLEPQNVAVLTTGQVMSENHPILCVCHDDDGVWQFHTGMDVNEEDAKVVALSEIVKLDLSVVGLADLPMGWTATRQSHNISWQRFKGEITTADAIANKNQAEY